MTTLITCKECSAELTVEAEGEIQVAMAAALQGWGYMKPDLYCPQHVVLVMAFAALVEAELSLEEQEEHDPQDDKLPLGPSLRWEVFWAKKAAYYMSQGVPFFECPECGAVSHNPNDIANKFCFQCHEFKGNQ